MERYLKDITFTDEKKSISVRNPGAYFTSNNSAIQRFETYASLAIDSLSIL